MDNGRCAEADTPAGLLARRDSIFSGVQHQKLPAGKHRWDLAHALLLTWRPRAQLLSFVVSFVPALRGG